LHLRSKKTQFKWVADIANYKKLDPSVRSKIKAAINQNKPMLQSIKDGRVQVLKHMRQVYTERTLSRLAKNHRFEIDSTFTLMPFGHVVDEAYAHEKVASHVGIICKKPLLS
jgi:hypothetical protein